MSVNPKRLVADLMTRNVTVVRRDADIHELEKLLLEHRVHGVPVVDDQERIVGVVSQTDLLAWHFENGVDGASFGETDPVKRGPDRLPVSDIRTARVEEVMSPLVHVIGPERSIAEAAVRMIRERIHRLVVVDAGFRVVGMLSAVDLLNVVPGVETFAGPRLEA